MCLYDSIDMGSHEPALATVQLVTGMCVQGKVHRYFIVTHGYVFMHIRHWAVTEIVEAISQIICTIHKVYKVNIHFQSPPAVYSVILCKCMKHAPNRN